MSETAKCRSCGAEILWAKTNTGKSVPLDAKPRRVFWPDEEKGTGAFMLLHESHFATCPNAAQHRKPE